MAAKSYIIPWFNFFPREELHLKRARAGLNLLITLQYQDGKNHIKVFLTLYMLMSVRALKEPEKNDCNLFKVDLTKTQLVFD